jgi:PAS domain S-box-containing protein
MYRKLLTAELQEAILNSANFSNIATDEKGVIQVFNVGAERMLGYSAADVIDRITPADISDRAEIVARAAALSAEYAIPIAPGFEALVFRAVRTIEDIYELTYICKDGSRVPAVVSVTALRNSDNAIIGYLLIGTDNTVRKQVEDEQKELDQRLRDLQFYTRSLFESNFDALVATDPSGTITDVNRQMETLTGCTRDELIGAPFKNYFTDPQGAEKGIARALKEHAITNCELTARSHDGELTVVSLNATTFFDRDRKLKGVIATARDITDRNRIEQALQETNSELKNAKIAAERANEAKSDFLSCMSHELRSPLNAILGFAQLMESGTPPPTPLQQDSIGHILKAGWYLLDLINEILDLALVESGKLMLSPEPVSLGDVLADCRAMIEPQAAKSGIRVDFPEFASAIYVNADRTRVKQVFLNLLSNAIKYNRVAGSVEVTVDEPVAGRRIRVRFRDTGEGLPAEKIGQLFQPFNRLGREVGAEEGTGIGLVVSKRLVELMEGEIGVDSCVGVGSTFWIELNAARAPDHVDEAAATDPHAQVVVAGNTALRTVLCVEDNPMNLALVQKLLARRTDVRLVCAQDAMRGIELAHSSRPDVILMDINLPGMNGITALRILAHDPATAHIPVIALSANAMPRDVEKGLEAGFFRYLTKPMKIDLFMDTLDLALKLSSGRQSPASRMETA